jgi:hypothetical protein
MIPPFYRPYRQLVTREIGMHIANDIMPARARVSRKQ